jgi:hypothetical protein
MIELILDFSVKHWQDDFIVITEGSLLANARYVTLLSVCHFVFQLIFHSQYRARFQADEKSLAHIYTYTIVGIVIHAIFCLHIIKKILAHQMRSDHDEEANVANVRLLPAEKLRFYFILDISSVALQVFFTVLMLIFLLSVKSKYPGVVHKGRPNQIKWIIAILIIEIVSCVRHTIRLTCRYAETMMNGNLMLVNRAIITMISFIRMILFCGVMLGVDDDLKSFYVDIMFILILLLTMYVRSLRMFKTQLNSYQVLFLHFAMLLRVFVISREVGRV